MTGYQAYPWLLALGDSARPVPHATALAITLALALPLPIVLWTAATLLATAPDNQPFTLALGVALLAISRLLLAISTLAWLLDRRGVAIRHFGWDSAA